MKIGDKVKAIVTGKIGVIKSLVGKDAYLCEYLHEHDCPYTDSKRIQVMTFIVSKENCVKIEE